MKNLVYLTFIVIALMISNGYAQIINQSDSKSAKITSGLVFEKEVENRLEGSTYTEVIQLRELKEKAQALQFRILLNKSDDDTEILKFKDIQKGSDLKDPSWLLDYNVIKSKSDSKTESEDEIYVVIYNSNLKGGLSPGNYNDLIKVIYEVVDVASSGKELRSSIKISHAQASSFDGFPISIEPTRDQVKINIKRK